MFKYVLIIWINGTYLGVDGIANEGACKDLHRKMVEVQAISERQEWFCLPYEVE